MKFGKIFGKDFSEKNAEIAFGLVAFIILLVVGLAFFIRMKRKKTQKFKKKKSIQLNEEEFREHIQAVKRCEKTLQDEDVSRMPRNYKKFNDE